MYSNATYVFLFWKKVRETKNTNIESSMIPHGVGVIATNFDYFKKILLHFHFHKYYYIFIFIFIPKKDKGHKS